MSSSGENMRIKALIVGVNNYIDSKGLRYCVNDATSIRELLRNIYDPKDMILISDGLEPRFTPLRNNILSNIRLISDAADEKDNIFFYFAGHGKDISGEPALLPSDYRDEIGLDAAIRIEDVKKEFANSKAKFKLLILDSCHSGAVKGREESGKMSSSMLEVINDVPEGFAIISACGLNQRSFENEKLKHGVFTFHLLEGVKGKADANGDGEVSVNELYDYVTPRVKDWVFREHNASQIPHIRSNFGGVYVVNRLPKEMPESKDTFGTELFKDIYLETETHEMEWVKFEAQGIEPEIEDALEETVKKTLLILRKTYGIGGLEDTKSEISFEDGKVIRNVASSERRNITKFSIIVHFKYQCEIWNRIDNLILELDDLKSTRKKIEFRTKKELDFNKIENLCTKNDYEIKDLKLTSPKSLTFVTDFFSDTSNRVSVSEYDDYSSVSVSSKADYYPYLNEHFYTLINPKKATELFVDVVSE